MSIAGLGGGAAAYKQLQRLPNEVGSVMSGIASRQQADKNANLARNERAKIAKDKKDDDFYNSVDIDPDDFVVEATGWADADEIFGAVSQEAMDLSIDLNTKARKAWDMGNEEEARGYSDEAKRIQGSFKNFASKREQVGVKMSEWENLITEGKVLDGAQGQFYDALNRNEYKLDYSNGDFVITALMRDKNGEIIYEDGKAKYEQTTMNDLIKGNNDPYQFEDAMGEGGMIDNLMVSFGKFKIEESSGNYLKTDTSWSKENDIALQNYIDGITGGDSGTPNNREMYKWYKNATGEGKITKNAKDWTKEEKDAVAKYIREGVDSKFGRVVSLKNKPMRSTSGSRPSEADLKRQPAQPILVKDKSGRASQNLYKKYPKAASENGNIREYTVNTRAGGNPTKIIQAYPSASLKSVAIDSDGNFHGQYTYNKKSTVTVSDSSKPGQFAEIAEEESKTSKTSDRRDESQTITETEQLTDTEVSNLARFYGLPNRDALLAYFLNIESEVGYGDMPNNTTTPNTNTPTGNVR